MIGFRSICFCAALLLLFACVEYHPYDTRVSGDEFWIKEPCKYGGGYYDFAPGVRTHLFVGQRINYKALSQGTLHNVSLYYEFSICDLNLISKVTNHRLKLTDIVFFSAGLRFVIIKP